MERLQASDTAHPSEVIPYSLWQLVRYFLLLGSLGLNRYRTLRVLHCVRRDPSTGCRARGSTLLRHASQKTT